MPPVSSFGQARLYSSDSKDEPAGGLGFQSLSALFPSPPPAGRYSQPKQRRSEEEVAPKDVPKKATKETPEKAVESKEPFFNSAAELSENQYKAASTPEEPAKSTSTPTKDVEESEKPESRGFSIRSIEKDYEWSATRWKKHVAGQLHGKELTKLFRAGKMSKEQYAEEMAKLPPQPEKAEDPTKGAPRASSRDRTLKTSAKGKGKTSSRSVPKQERLKPDFMTEKPAEKKPATEGSASQKPSATAWGLSRDEEDTIASFAEPPAVPAEQADDVNPKHPSKYLTHVKPSGEAHMVDVGAKPSTKRVAIAHAYIPVTAAIYQQIEENSNKKGDVLGIARIAGIMAAKRTPDIIPLCHPIAITKAEVDVYLIPKERRVDMWKRSHGQLVAIQARVECVGPTGVEMEALTAVQGAALTVVDMCKAMEKSLTIHAAKVVFKSGGRSGVSGCRNWKKEVGTEKFAETGELMDGVGDLLVRGRLHHEKPRSGLGSQA